MYPARINEELVGTETHEKLCYSDNSFDALFHSGGVYFFNDPDKAISEFIRVEKNGIVN